MEEGEAGKLHLINKLLLILNRKLREYYHMRIRYSQDSLPPGSISPPPIGTREVPDQADVQGSGTIDHGKSIVATLHLNKVDKERDHLIDIFSYFDSDEDGRITKDELQLLWGSLGIGDVCLEEKTLKAKQDYTRRENVLPLSWKDLGNTLFEEKPLNWKAFLRFTRGSVLNIPSRYHVALLLLCGSFLSYQAKSLTAPFDFQLRKTSNTPQSLLSFGEAFDAFFPEMAHITKFMICYFLTLMLVLPLQHGVQIFCMLLLISTSLFYFPELVHKASRVDVACGSFKLPLIWFATLGAFGLSLICGFVTLLMVYISWRFIYKGKPRVKELEVSLDGLYEVLGG